VRSFLPGVAGQLRDATWGEGRAVSVTSSLRAALDGSPAARSRSHAAETHSVLVNTFGAPLNCALLDVQGPSYRRGPLLSVRGKRGLGHSSFLLRGPSPRTPRAVVVALGVWLRQGWLRSMVQSDVSSAALNDG
jgi:hypothetical protein